MDIDLKGEKKNEKISLANYDGAQLDFDSSQDLSHAKINIDSQRTTISSNDGGYQPPVLTDSSEPVKTEQPFANKYQEQAAQIKSNFDLNEAGHPIVCIFTVLFKGLSVFSYLFLPLFSNDVIGFILSVLFAAFDFWTVKNVSGRKLVGLRWRTILQDDGSEKW
eukprot:CAMPEP_0176463626 /NCGR_PEP_ID=MMETSP0127-20121128/36002_1 /TAXON_ID=938130 /ORGANISM="Platyophrya macrostoma, Strain WH" /LENGTH=163 /DNA_ID=CAMNT_0017855825 /DNA_START=15 /DNA_END=503 /DNA_ORIENTATION=+